ncbi:MAG TPA: hypothetical protein VK436_11305 [Methanocella sp.]|nr:hypothetical protein [Methanocella sp.]
MPKWICTVCGTEHHVLCTPGRCHSFHGHGSCCPPKCKGCGASGDKMVMGGLPPGTSPTHPELAAKRPIAPTGPPP